LEVVPAAARRCPGLGLGSGSRPGRTCAITRLCRRTPTTAAEHDQLADVDLRGVLGLAILVLPLAVFDAALAIQLVTFLYIALHDVRERGGLGVPDHAAMP